METDNKHFTDKIVSALRSAATELEALQVQASLGKAEASDKYEEVKKNFNHFVHNMKSKASDGKDKLDDLHQKFDELRLQLALGKAETLEAFQEQKKKILLTIHDIQHNIKTNPTLNRIYAVLVIEMEKFKVQLDWLEKKFGEGKEEFSSSFEEGKASFNAYIEKMKEKYSKTEEPEETRWEHFQSEISEAFGHIKGAFVKS